VRLHLTESNWAPSYVDEVSLQSFANIQQSPTPDTFLDEDDDKYLMNVYCILDILFIFYYSIYTTQKSQEVESA
jgi:hypothetical protein